MTTMSQEYSTRVMMVRVNQFEEIEEDVDEYLSIVYFFGVDEYCIFFGECTGCHPGW